MTEVLGVSTGIVEKAISWRFILCGHSKDECPSELSAEMRMSRAQFHGSGLMQWNEHVWALKSESPWYQNENSDFIIYKLILDNGHIYLL